MKDSVPSAVAQSKGFASGLTGSRPLLLASLWGK
jgi:hypothetical protein